MTTLEPDRASIEIFVNALLRYATDGFISVRSFYEARGSKSFRIFPTRLNGAGSLQFLVDVAEDVARHAANDPSPVVFCPPLAVFTNDRAREKDLEAGLVLSVELDSDPRAGLSRLEQTLGPATLVVRSGGRTSDGEQKLHAHWRLARPARGEDLAKLKEARKLATRLAEGDSSNVPPVHPIRWPGSWHRKAEPKLCEIDRVDPDLEIDLDESLEALEAAAPAPAPRQYGGNGYGGEGEDWESRIKKILDAEEIYPACVPLTMSLQRAGLQDGAVVNLTRAIVNLSQARTAEPQRWRNAYDKIPAMVRDGRAKIEGDGGYPDQPQRANLWPWQFYGRQEITTSRPYLVDKLLPATGVGLISGQWGTYKTFVAIDLAAAVITETAFAGFEIARQGAVLFVAMEGQDEIDIRTRAALDHRAYREALAPFAWIDTCPRLLDPDAGKILAAMVKQAAEKMLKDFGLPVALVIFDTAGKAAGYSKAGDENDAVLARQVVGALAEASRETGALFLGVDHFGKAAETGTRGSSAKEADADVVLALLGEKNVSGEVTNPRLAIRKRRSGPNGVEIPLRTKVVQAEYGETTLVIDWLQADQVAPAAKPDRWGKALRLLRQTLMNVLVNHGAEQQPWPDGPTVRAADIEIVRAEFYKSYPAHG